MRMHFFAQFLSFSKPSMVGEYLEYGIRILPPLLNSNVTLGILLLKGMFFHL